MGEHAAAGQQRQRRGQMIELDFCCHTFLCSVMWAIVEGEAAEFEGLVDERANRPAVIFAVGGDRHPVDRHLVPGRSAIGDFDGTDQPGVVELGVRPRLAPPAPQVRLGHPDATRIDVEQREFDEDAPGGVFGHHRRGPDDLTDRKAVLWVFHSLPTYLRGRTGVLGATCRRGARRRTSRAACAKMTLQHRVSGRLTVGRPKLSRLPAYETRRRRGRQLNRPDEQPPLMQ